MIATSPDSFVISLPLDWSTLSLDPDNLVESVRETVQQLGQHDLVNSVEFRRQLLVIKRAAEHAELAGLCLLAVYAQEVAEGGGEEAQESAPEPTVLSALAYIATRPALAFGVETIDFAALLAAVQAQELSPRSERLQIPEVIELPHGPAIREVWLCEPDPGDRANTALLLRYVMMIGQGEGVGVLGFITPNVELADEFGDLFESIAMTLEFVKA